MDIFQLLSIFGLNVFKKGLNVLRNIFQVLRNEENLKFEELDHLVELVLILVCAGHQKINEIVVMPTQELVQLVR
jgi:hypothetical protein